MLNGIIATVYNNHYEVYIDDLLVNIQKNKKYNNLAVGDFCLIEKSNDGYSIIKVLERKTTFFRLDPSSSDNKDQLIASNFNYVFCITSLNNEFNFKRLERLFILAANTGAKPIIILSKADLVQSYHEHIDIIKKSINNVKIIATSIISMEGINEIKSYLIPENTILFLGSSGVGKSSLINMLMGSNTFKTGEIRKYDDKGRHTTVVRKMIRLNNGAKIIDTPGFKKFGLVNVEKAIKEYFKDIENLAMKCKFKNCKHKTELGCAVKNALMTGSLSFERYDRWLNLKSEALKFHKGNKKHQKYNRNESKKETMQLIENQLNEE